MARDLDSAFSTRRVGFPEPFHPASAAKLIQGSRCFPEPDQTYELIYEDFDTCLATF